MSNRAGYITSLTSVNVKTSLVIQMFTVVCIGALSGVLFVLVIYICLKKYSDNVSLLNFCILTKFSTVNVHIMIFNIY